MTIFLIAKNGKADGTDTGGPEARTASGYIRLHQLQIFIYLFFISYKNCTRSTYNNNNYYYY